MTFEHPLFLLALIPLLAITAWTYRAGLRRRPGARYPALSPFARGGTTATVRLRGILPLMRFLGAAALIVALARPQIVEREEEIRTEGIDIMLALDISGSMKAEDFKPENRLNVAKQVVDEFLGLVTNDRIGLVVFAGQAFTQCPLTLDYDVLRTMLARVEIGMIEDGTAIGTALANCVNRLKDSEAKSKVAILLTDGENNAGKIDPMTASKVAKALGVRVYTIGVGKEGGAPIPVDHPVFGKSYARNPDGSLVLTKIDEKSLREIAGTTGGEYFRATDAEALKKIYEQILNLERTKFQVKQFEKVQELYRWAAVPGVLLLVLELLLAHTRLRVLP
ncbi:MAG: VWA domain-containing protein [bacterium]